eukprot:Awhi_evm1s6875
MSGLNRTKHCFLWTEDYITFESRNLDDNSVLIRWNYTDASQIPTTGNEKIRFNLWQFQNVPPETNETQWVLLDFDFTPLTPTVASLTLLEDIGQGGFHLKFNSPEEDIDNALSYEISAIQGNLEVEFSYGDPNMTQGILSSGFASPPAVGYDYDGYFFLNLYDESDVTLVVTLKYENYEGLTIVEYFNQVLLAPEDKHICHSVFASHHFQVITYHHLTASCGWVNVYFEAMSDLSLVRLSVPEDPVNATIYYPGDDDDYTYPSLSENTQEGNSDFVAFKVISTRTDVIAINCLVEYVVSEDDRDIPCTYEGLIGINVDMSVCT